MFVQKVGSLLSADEVSKIVDGTLLHDAGIKISGMCSLDAPDTSSIAFYKESSEQVIRAATRSGTVAALLISKSCAFDSYADAQTSVIAVENPHLSFVDLISHFFEERKPQPGIHPSAVVESSATVDESAYVGPFSYIGEDAFVGPGSVVHPHVTVYAGAHIGAHVCVHSGAVIREFVQVKDHVVIQNGAIIGADGFGYVPDPTRGLRFVPQVGTVVLNEHTEIGANTCIDRAALDETSVGIGSKIDNLVQIGHNTVVGAHSIICGQSAIAGSSKIGNQVILGGNVGVADHTEIADGCRFAAFSGLHGQYTEKGDYAGNPAMPARTYRRVVAITPKLPDLFRSVKRLLGEK